MVETEVERQAFQILQRRLNIAMPQALLHTVQEELQHDVTLAVPRPSDGVLHSASRSPSKSRADHERTQTPTRTPTSSQHIVAPLTATEAQQNLESVVTHGCKRKIVCRGVVAMACHNPNGRRLLSRHGRAALRGTTVPDSTWHGVSGRAMPQSHGCRSPSPSAGQQRLSRKSSDTCLSANPGECQM